MFEILEADIVVMQEAKIQKKDLQDDMVLVPGWDVFFSLPKHKKGMKAAENEFLRLTSNQDTQELPSILETHSVHLSEQKKESPVSSPLPTPAPASVTSPKTNKSAAIQVRINSRTVPSMLLHSILKDVA